MTNKDSKDAVLKASRKVLGEYNDGTHKCDMKCSICLLADGTGDDEDQSVCADCIMTPFKKPETLSIHCYERKCIPWTYVYQSDTKRRKRATLFWEKVIELLENTGEELFIKKWWSSDWWTKGVVDCDVKAYEEVV